MLNKQFYHKTISKIVPVRTGHGIGEKRVLLSYAERLSPITQIAQTHLNAGESVEGHCHPTMDEHFIFLDGECIVTINDSDILCKKGEYLLVPAGVSHQIEVLTDTEMITIGVVTE